LHVQYPLRDIVDALILGTSKLTILFATVALDSYKEHQVYIYKGVPCSMEEYFQDTGRAERDDLPSSAHMFYNYHDISKA